MLRALREERGISQEQLGHEIESGRTYISQLEHDRKSPTVAVLFRLCDALGVSASKLLARVERTRRGQHN